VRNDEVVLPCPSSICVFCGSRDPLDPLLSQKGAELGSEMVKRGYDLVYGGGTVGLMGILARQVQKDGGKVLGIIPQSLTPKEVSGEMIGEAIVVKAMHARKLTMYQKADAFIALPGGFGTMEELFEVITWSQLGIHSKPIGILNVKGYWDPLLDLMNNAVKHGFIKSELAQEILVVSSEPVELLNNLATHISPKAEVNWLKEDQV